MDVSDHCAVIMGKAAPSSSVAGRTAAIAKSLGLASAAVLLLLEEAALWLSAAHIESLAMLELHEISGSFLPCKLSEGGATSWLWGVPIFGTCPGGCLLTCGWPDHTKLGHTSPFLLTVSASTRAL